MKMTIKLISAISFLFLLNSCVSIKEDLPRDLPKALLIIRKNDIEPTPKGEGKGLEKFAAGMGNWRSKGVNKKLDKVYAKYPFRYTVMDYFYMGDSISLAEAPVYILFNGSTTTVTNFSPTGGRSSKSKTQVLLYNYQTGKTKQLCLIKGGTVNVSKLLLKKIKKQFPKKKSSSKSKSTKSRKK